MSKLPHTRLIGQDYWKAYFAGRTIDIYRTGSGWVAFAGGLGALRHVGTTKAGVLKAACDYILAEQDAEVD